MLQEWCDHITDFTRQSLNYHTGQLVHWLLIHLSPRFLDTVAQDFRYTSTLLVWKASLLKKWHQSGPSAALPVPKKKRKKACRGPISSLLQTCKWISPIPPRFVKWGSMGLLLFFSASLSPRSSVMSTVKQRCKLGPWEKKGGGRKKSREEITAIMISVRATAGLQLFL